MWSQWRNARRENAWTAQEERTCRRDQHLGSLKTRIGERRECPPRAPGGRSRSARLRDLVSRLRVFACALSTAHGSKLTRRREDAKGPTRQRLQLHDLLLLHLRLRRPRLLDLHRGGRR